MHHGLHRGQCWKIHRSYASLPFSFWVSFLQWEEILITGQSLVKPQASDQWFLSLLNHFVPGEVTLPCKPVTLCGYVLSVDGACWVWEVLATWLLSQRLPIPSDHSPTRKLTKSRTWMYFNTCCFFLLWKIVFYILRPTCSHKELVPMYLNVQQRYFSYFLSVFLFKNFNCSKNG